MPRKKTPSLSIKRGEKLPASKGAGLTAKGRKKINRATGSKLKAPVTGKVKKGSKAANRRKSFCARMGGAAKKAKKNNTRAVAAMKRWKCSNIPKLKK